MFLTKYIHDLVWEIKRKAHLEAMNRKPRSTSGYMKHHFAVSLICRNRNLTQCVNEASAMI